MLSRWRSRVAAIKAVSFDLWDTLVVDDSDEPKRQARGLRTKRQERRHLVWEALNRQAVIPVEQVTLAYDVADAAFNRVWHDQHVTWTIRERLLVLLAGLGRNLPEPELDTLVRRHETMEVDIPPDLISGVGEALADLHERYKLCVVSDAIVTPGRELRRLLGSYGLARFFDAFIFSDEVGHSKPSPEMFRAAAKALGVDLPSMVHVGDRQHNDVAGAKSLGMKTVLFIAARAVDRPGNTADAVCERYQDLGRTIAALNR